MEEEGGLTQEQIEKLPRGKHPVIGRKFCPHGTDGTQPICPCLCGGVWCPACQDWVL